MAPPPHCSVAAGCPTLAVDSDSPTGAFGLSAGMGFVPTHRKMAYTFTF